MNHAPSTYFAGSPSRTSNGAAAAGTAAEALFGDLSRHAQCPPFWIPKPEQAAPLLRSLKQACLRTLGQSAGGRDILAIEYGEREPLQTTTDNLHSAIAAKIVPPDPTEIYPDAFYGQPRRRKPVVVLQGGIHGGELTGTVASLNLCRIIETGVDLRDRPWPRLAELARRMRICIIPWLNPDGVERWLLPNPTEASHELAMRLTQGVSIDGETWTHPQVKELWPIPPRRTRYMGSYYNDAGVNLQYDFTAVERQPETTAWMQYYLDERPDGIVIWHCDAGSLIGPPPYYLPVGVQTEIARVAGAVRGRLVRDGYPVHRLSWQLPGMGKPFLEQMAATYHVCGATPVMCELPIGTRDYPFTLDAMLDIGLIAIEEILAYADSDGLRAYESWEKVRRSRQRPSS